MPLIGPGRRMVRRRTVVGAAAVGGAAYYAGKKSQQGAEREADQEERLEDVEAATAPATAPAAEESYIDELEQLSKLHEQGVLTDEEFEAKKKEILGI